MLLWNSAQSLHVFSLVMNLLYCCISSSCFTWGFTLPIFQTCNNKTMSKWYKITQYSWLESREVGIPHLFPTKLSSCPCLTLMLDIRIFYLLPSDSQQLNDSKWHETRGYLWLEIQGTGIQPFFFLMKLVFLTVYRPRVWHEDILFDSQWLTVVEWLQIMQDYMVFMTQEPRSRVPLLFPMKFTSLPVSCPRVRLEGILSPHNDSQQLYNSEWCEMMRWWTYRLLQAENTRPVKANVVKHRIWRQVLASLVLHLHVMTVASGEVVKYCYTLLWLSEGCSEAQGMYVNFPGREGMRKRGCMLSGGDLDAVWTM